MLTQDTSPQIQQLLEPVLDLSPQERLQAVIILLHSLMDSNGITEFKFSQALIKDSYLEPEKINYVDDVPKGLWLEDGFIDDFLVFLQAQRKQLPLLEPVKSVEEARANFWPEDESIDDFLEFINEQRRMNRIS